MKVAEMFLMVARDEADTLVKYQSIRETVEDMDEESKAIMDEIMSDEMNHGLIALLTASKLLGIKIGTDELSKDPNEIKVVEEGEDDADPVSTELQ